MVKQKMLCVNKLEVLSSEAKQKKNLKPDTKPFQVEKYVCLCCFFC